MKKKLGAIVRIVVSVGILAYLFTSIFQKEAAKYFTSHHLDPQTLAWGERMQIVWTQGPQSIWEAFCQVSPVWFGLGILCVGMTCSLGILRWQWILRVQGLELPFSRTASIMFIGLFFNAFMLGSTGGDVVKAWYVAHETHHKKAEAVATVVVDRLIGLLGLFVIALVMMAIYHQRVFNDVRLRYFALITLTVVVATVVGTALTFWRGWSQRTAWLQRLPHYDTLRRLVEACRTYATHPVVLAKTTLVTFGVHIFSMLTIVCIGHGMGISAGVVDYFLYLPIINSVTAIPISISGFGVREAMYVKMFGEVGVASSPALALSLLGYLAVLVWSIVGSVFYLTHRKELPPTAQMASDES